MRPFLDHALQLRPARKSSDLFRARITRGISLDGGLATLHTLRSPSYVCVASMSDFCLEEEACHAKVAIGDGLREVVRVCKIVNVGVNPASNIDPLL
jgi:hypothetical protein